MRARRHILAFCILVCCYCLTKGQVKGHPLSKKILPAFCIEVAGPANVYTYAGSRKKGILPNLHPVRIESIRGNWVKVRYTLDIDIEICNGTANLLDSGFVHINRFPHAGLLSRNFIPANSHNESLVKIFSMGEDEISKDYQFFFPDEEGIELLTIKKAVSKPENELEYAFIFTGQKKYPFALFYTGNTGHLLIDPPEIILFGDDQILPWFPNEGNRIMAKLIGISDSYLTIKEAFLCKIPIKVKLSWEKGALKRAYGIFFEIKQYPSNKLIRHHDPNIEKLQMLTEPMKIYKEKEKKNEIAIIKINTKIIIRLLEVDFLNNSVFVEVNSEIGWTDLETIQNLPLLNSGIIGDCAISN